MHEHTATAGTHERHFIAAPRQVLLERFPRAEQGTLAWEQLENLAFHHGDSPDSYLATEPHGEFLLWREGQGAATLDVDGRQWHVPGGLLTAEPDKAEFLDDLLTLARRERAVLSVYSVADSDRSLFEQSGFQVTKFGEEPVVDLRGLTWEGKAFEWVRRQTNFCRRQGLQVVEACRPTRFDVDKTVCAKDADWLVLKHCLHEIQTNDLNGRPFEKPLRLFEGQLFPDHLHRRRLFLARQANGYVEGYCIANPYQGGAGWAIEMYRRRRESTRGVIAFLIREVIDQFAREGAAEVSLCIVPGRGLEQGTARESRWARWALRAWHRLSPPGFSLPGQEHFKTRFRPRFRNRYMAIAPGASLSSLLSFIRVSGGFCFSPWRTLRAHCRGRRL